MSNFSKFKKWPSKIYRFFLVYTLVINLCLLNIPFQNLAFAGATDFNTATHAANNATDDSSDDTKPPSDVGGNIADNFGKNDCAWGEKRGELSKASTGDENNYEDCAQIKDEAKKKKCINKNVGEYLGGSGLDMDSNGQIQAGNSETQQKLKDIECAAEKLGWITMFLDLVSRDIEGNCVSSKIAMAAGLVGLADLGIMLFGDIKLRKLQYEYWSKQKKSAEVSTSTTATSSPSEQDIQNDALDYLGKELQELINLDIAKITSTAVQTALHAAAMAVAIYETVMMFVPGGQSVACMAPNPGTGGVMATADLAGMMGSMDKGKGWKVATLDAPSSGTTKSAGGADLPGNSGRSTASAGSPSGGKSGGGIEGSAPNSNNKSFGASDDAPSTVSGKGADEAPTSENLANSNPNSSKFRDTASEIKTKNGVIDAFPEGGTNPKNLTSTNPSGSGKFKNAASDIKTKNSVVDAFPEGGTKPNMSSGSVDAPSTNKSLASNSDPSTNVSSNKIDADSGRSAAKSTDDPTVPTKSKLTSSSTQTDADISPAPGRSSTEAGGGLNTDGNKSRLSAMKDKAADVGSGLKDKAKGFLTKIKDTFILKKPDAPNGIGKSEFDVEPLSTKNSVAYAPSKQPADDFDTPTNNTSGRRTSSDNSSSGKNASSNKSKTDSGTDDVANTSPSKSADDSGTLTIKDQKEIDAELKANKKERAAIKGDASKQAEMDELKAQKKATEERLFAGSKKEFEIDDKTAKDINTLDATFKDAPEGIKNDYDAIRQKMSKEKLSASEIADINRSMDGLAKKLKDQGIISDADYSKFKAGKKNKMANLRQDASRSAALDRQKFKDDEKQKLKDKDKVVDQDKLDAKQNKKNIESAKRMTLEEIDARKPIVDGKLAEYEADLVGFKKTDPKSKTPDVETYDLKSMDAEIKKLDTEINGGPLSSRVNPKGMDQKVKNAVSENASLNKKLADLDAKKKTTQLSPDDTKAKIEAEGKIKRNNELIDKLTAEMEPAKAKLKKLKEYRALAEESNVLKKAEADRTLKAQARSAEIEDIQKLMDQKKEIEGGKSPKDLEFEKKELQGNHTNEMADLGLKKKEMEGKTPPLKKKGKEINDLNDNNDALTNSIDISKRNIDNVNAKNAELMKDSPDLKDLAGKRTAVNDKIKAKQKEIQELTLNKKNEAPGKTDGPDSNILDENSPEALRNKAKLKEFDDRRQKIQAEADKIDADFQKNKANLEDQIQNTNKKLAELENNRPPRNIEGEVELNNQLNNTKEKLAEFESKKNAANTQLNDFDNTPEAKKLKDDSNSAKSELEKEYNDKIEKQRLAAGPGDNSSLGKFDNDITKLEVEIDVGNNKLKNFDNDPNNLDLKKQSDAKKKTIADESEVEKNTLESKKKNFETDEADIKKANEKLAKDKADLQEKIRLKKANEKLAKDKADLQEKIRLKKAEGKDLKVDKMTREISIEKASIAASSKKMTNTDITELEAARDFFQKRVEESGGKIGKDRLDLAEKLIKEKRAKNAGPSVMKKNDKDINKLFVAYYKEDVTAFNKQMGIKNANAEKAAKFKQELDDLNNKLGDFDNKLKTNNKKLSDIENQKKLNDQAISKLDAQTKQKLDAEDTSFKTASKGLEDKYKAELQSNQAKLKDVQDQKTALASNIGGKKAAPDLEIKKLENELKQKLELEDKNLDGNIAASKNKLQNEIDGHDSKIKDLNIEIDGLNKKLVDTDTNNGKAVQAHEANIQNVRNELAGMKKNLDSENSKFNTAKSGIDNDLAGLDTDIKNFQPETPQKQKVTDSDTGLGKAKKELDDLIKEKNGLDENIRMKNPTVLKNLEIADSLANHIDNSKLKIEANSKKLSAIKDEHPDYHDLVMDMRNKDIAVKKKVKDLDNEINIKKKGIGDIDKKIRALDPNRLAAFTNGKFGSRKLRLDMQDADGIYLLKKKSADLDAQIKAKENGGTYDPKVMDDLKAKRTALEDDFNGKQKKLEEDIDLEKKKIEDYTKRQLEAENNRKALETENEGINKQLEDLDDQINGSLSKADSEIGDLNADREKLAASIREDLKGEFELKYRKRKNDADIEIAKKKIAELQADADVLAIKKKNTIEPINKKINDLEVDIAKTQADINALMGKNIDSDPQFGNLNNAISAKETEIKELGDRIELAKRSPASDSDFKKISDEFGKKKADADSLAATEKQKIDEDYLNNKQELDTQGKALDSDYDKNKADLENRIKGHQDGIAKLKKELDGRDLDKELKPLKDDLAQNTKDLDATKANVAKNKNRLENFESDPEVSGIREKATGERTDINNDIDARKNANKNKLKKLDDEEAKLANEIKDIENQGKNLISKKKELDNLKKKLEEDSKNLKGNYIEANTKLAGLKGENLLPDDMDAMVQFSKDRSDRKIPGFNLQDKAMKKAVETYELNKGKKNYVYTKAENKIMADAFRNFEAKKIADLKAKKALDNFYSKNKLNEGEFDAFAENLDAKNKQLEKAKAKKKKISDKDQKLEAERKKRIAVVDDAEADNLKTTRGKIMRELDIDLESEIKLSAQKKGLENKIADNTLEHNNINTKLKKDIDDLEQNLLADNKALGELGDKYTAAKSKLGKSGDEDLTPEEIRDRKIAEVDKKLKTDKENFDADEKLKHNELLNDLENKKKIAEGNLNDLNAQKLAMENKLRSDNSQALADLENKLTNQKKELADNKNELQTTNDDFDNAIADNNNQIKNQDDSLKDMVKKASPLNSQLILLTDARRAKMRKLKGIEDDIKAKTEGRGLASGDLLDQQDKLRKKLEDNNKKLGDSNNKSMDDEIDPQRLTDLEKQLAVLKDNKRKGLSDLDDEEANLKKLAESDDVDQLKKQKDEIDKSIAGFDGKFKDKNLNQDDQSKRIVTTFDKFKVQMKELGNAALFALKKFKKFMGSNAVYQYVFGVDNEKDELKREITSIVDPAPPTPDVFDPPIEPEAPKPPKEPKPPVQPKPPTMAKPDVKPIQDEIDGLEFEADRIRKRLRYETLKENDRNSLLARLREIGDLVKEKQLKIKKIKDDFVRQQNSGYLPTSAYLKAEEKLQYLNALIKEKEHTMALFKKKMPLPFALLKMYANGLKNGKDGFEEIHRIEDAIFLDKERKALIAGSIKSPDLKEYNDMRNSGAFELNAGTGSTLNMVSKIALEIPETIMDLAFPKAHAFLDKILGPVVDGMMGEAGKSKDRDHEYANEQEFAEQMAAEKGKVVLNVGATIGVTMLLKFLIGKIPLANGPRTALSTSPGILVLEALETTVAAINLSHAAIELQALQENQTKLNALKEKFANVGSLSSKATGDTKSIEATSLDTLSKSKTINNGNGSNSASTGEKPSGHSELSPPGMCATNNNGHAVSDPNCECQEANNCAQIDISDVTKYDFIQTKNDSLDYSYIQTRVNDVYNGSAKLSSGNLGKLSSDLKLAAKFRERNNAMLQNLNELRKKEGVEPIDVGLDAQLRMMDNLISSTMPENFASILKSTSSGATDTRPPMPKELDEITKDISISVASVPSRQPSSAPATGVDVPKKNLANMFNFQKGKERKDIDPLAKKEMLKKSYQNKNQIIPVKDSSIFTILTNRYIKTGLPLLLEEN